MAQSAWVRCFRSLVVYVSICTVAVLAMGMSSCNPDPVPPKTCESGVGTLMVVNNSGVSLDLTADPAIGSNPIRIDGPARGIEAPIGVYTLSIASAADETVLLSGQFEATCDKTTEVVVSAVAEVRHTVSISVQSLDGEGTGSVEINVIGAGPIRPTECSGDCQLSVKEGAKVWISRKSQSARSVWEGFTGDCTGLFECRRTITSALSVQTGFARAGEIKIAAGIDHTCALVRGRVRCWGANNLGQLGVNRSYTELHTPQFVTGLLAEGQRAIDLAAGSNTSCAIVEVIATGERMVKCWGSNGAQYQMLGNRTVESDFVDQAVISDMLMLAPGENLEGIAIGSNAVCAAVNGQARCWGNLGYRGVNQDQAVDDSANGIASTATDLGGVRRLSASTYVTCASTSIGDVKCWGYNSSGEVGQTTDLQAIHHLPASVPGIFDARETSIVALATGPREACAVRRVVGERDELICWGLVPDGSAAEPTPSDPTWMKYVIPQLDTQKKIEAVTLSMSEDCVILDGGAYCWGRYKPFAQVPTLVSGVTDIERGFNHGCVVVSEGVKCWGAGDKGQLASDEGTSGTTPMQVRGFLSGPSDGCTGPGYVTVANGFPSGCVYVVIQPTSPDGVWKDVMACGTGTEETVELPEGDYTWFATPGSPGDNRIANGTLHVSCAENPRIVLDPSICAAGEIALEGYPGRDPSQNYCFEATITDTVTGNVLFTSQDCTKPYGFTLTGLAPGSYSVLVTDITDPQNPMTVWDQTESLGCNQSYTTTF